MLGEVRCCIVCSYTVLYHRPSCYTAHYGLYLVLYSSSLYQDQPSRAISGQQNGKLSTETMSPNSYSQKNNNELLFATNPNLTRERKYVYSLELQNKGSRIFHNHREGPSHHGESFYVCNINPPKITKSVAVFLLLRLQTSPIP